MIYSWTKEDIEAILVQLNNRDLPFKNYGFSKAGEGLNLLGSGASANVYKAVSKDKKKSGFAVKVIGFGNKHVDSESFKHSVDAQIALGLFEKNIVKIYDSIELRVWIEGEHDVSKVQKVAENEEVRPEGNYLHLQFILMELVEPILLSNKFEHKLNPYKLNIYDEQEIITLAYHIGTAIERAHKEGLIHRDIKLENVFYSSGDGQYKLGDFGIARITDDGLASTAAFTKGYGAPEVVGTLEDKYDYTADIYSFGMMLYVLLNEIRFPESTNYRPNVLQYVQGYVAPEPVRGSDELVRIVLKMIKFDPDDRYQSMEEVLNEFDKLKYGHRIKYQREHKNTALALGSVFAFVGAAVWKLSFAPDILLEFSLWIYALVALCIGKSVMKLANKETKFISLIILGLGIYLLISTGFTWWKLVVLFVLIFFDILPGIIGGGLLFSNITYMVMTMNSYTVADFYEYRWMAVLFLSLAGFLLVFYNFLGNRTEQVTKMYLGRNMMWMVAALYYLVLILLESTYRVASSSSINLYSEILGDKNIEAIMSWNPKLVGICGICFWVIWMVREWILVFIEKQLEKRAFG